MLAPRPFFRRPRLFAWLAGAAAASLAAIASPPAATEEAPMVALDGGEFIMGDDRGAHADETPAHRVRLRPFLLDATPVTNRQFGIFVAATGYRTDAERAGEATVFKEGFTDWETVRGADWRHPEGPGSDLAERREHPVVNVTWNDANAFARWAGKRLPSEAELEYAARGGIAGASYPWGNELHPDGQVRHNYWQGHWPEKNDLTDGFFYTSPTRAFPANAFGLHDMAGNVWQWSADYYEEDWYARSPMGDPRGPKAPARPTGSESRSLRGGSWFCSEAYCAGYRVAYRGRSPQDAAFNNTGFRCARDLRTAPAKPAAGGQ